MEIEPKEGQVITLSAPGWTEELPLGAMRTITEIRCLSCGNARTRASKLAPHDWAYHSVVPSSTYSKDLVALAHELGQLLSWLCPKCKCNCGECDNCVPW